MVQFRDDAASAASPCDHRPDGSARGPLGARLPPGITGQTAVTGGRSGHRPDGSAPGIASEQRARIPLRSPAEGQC
eukprot:478302-Heterocapsa_arctica.AAC.1